MIQRVTPMAMHIDMQEQIYGLIQPFAPEKILLGTTDIPSWKKDIDQEKDAVRDTPPSESIPFLTAKGKKRREIVSSLFLEIRAASTSPVETARKLLTASASSSIPIKAFSVRT